MSDPTAKTKLHEILAVEGDRNAAATAILAETITTFTKRPEHFMGHNSSYVPFDEADAATAEVSGKELVTTVADKLKHCFEVVGRAVDVTATKDATNQRTAAEVIINGVAITNPLPATTLLALESQLKKWMEVFLAIPTLAPGRKWEADSSKGEGVFTDAMPELQFKTKKSIKSKVLYDATKEHRAEIEKWAEDEKIGKTTVTKWCSMISPADKSAIIARCEELLAAVKQARQRANAQEVIQVSVADNLIKYLLG